MVDDNEVRPAHQAVMRRWMTPPAPPPPGSPLGGGASTDVAEAPECYLKDWERFDENPKLFVTTKKGGPSWEDVVRRETYDAWNKNLIASEEVNDENRHRWSMWHEKLPKTASWCDKNRIDI